MKYVCSCCATETTEPSFRKSKIQSKTSFTMCKKCLDHEPRHWLVLMARANGVLNVTKFVKNRRYCGPDITLAEVI